MTSPFLLIGSFTLWRHIFQPTSEKHLRNWTKPCSSQQRKTIVNTSHWKSPDIEIFCFRFSDQVSGLSKWVGSQLANLDAIPSYAIVISVCILITTFTEFTSNVATATIFLPILASLVRIVTTTNSVVFLFSRTLLCNYICFYRPKKFKFIRGI